MSKTKLNLNAAGMGFETPSQPAQPAIDPAEQARRDRQLASFVKTGSTPKEVKTATMRSYRIPDELVLQMETERFEATKAGKRITLTDIIVDALTNRYQGK